MCRSQKNELKELADAGNRGVGAALDRERVFVHSNVCCKVRGIRVGKRSDTAVAVKR